VRLLSNFIIRPPRAACRPDNTNSTCEERSWSVAGMPFPLPAKSEYRPFEQPTMHDLVRRTKALHGMRTET
jgi:hypothetical protein